VINLKLRLEMLKKYHVYYRKLLYSHTLFCVFSDAIQNFYFIYRTIFNEWATHCASIYVIPPEMVYKSFPGKAGKGYANRIPRRECDVHPEHHPGRQCRTTFRTRLRGSAETGEGVVKPPFTQ